MKSKLPNEPKTPALLQTLQLISSPTKFLETCAKRDGDPFTVRVLGLNSPPVVFFSNPQTIKDIFAFLQKNLILKRQLHVFQTPDGRAIVNFTRRA
jgi:cytochrome P450